MVKYFLFLIYINLSDFYRPVEDANCKIIAEERTFVINVVNLFSLH